MSGKLSIFDDGEKIGTITQIDDKVWILARSAREWGEIKRLTGYADPKHKGFLEKLASKAHEFNYSTELLELLELDAE